MFFRFSIVISGRNLDYKRALCCPHLQNNLSHLLPLRWCWYGTTKYHRKKDLADFDILTFYHFLRDNLRKYATEDRYQLHTWDQCSPFFSGKAFPSFLHMSHSISGEEDEVGWKLSWFLCVINSLTSDGKGWIMEREPLNFLKSALTLFEQWTEGNPNENLKKSEAMRKQTRVENVSWGL